MTMPAEILSMIISETKPADMYVTVISYCLFYANELPTDKPSHFRLEWSPAWIPGLMLVSKAFGQIFSSLLWTKLMFPLRFKQIYDNGGSFFLIRGDLVNKSLQHRVKQHLRRFLEDPR